MSKLNAAALTAALLIGMSGVAAAQATTPAPGAKAPGERRMEGRRGDFGGPGRHGRHGRHGRRAGRDFGRGFARDLNLTDAQRTQIRAIHDKYRPRIEAIHQQFRTQAEAARALRQKGDTAGARAAMQRLRTDIQAKIQPLRQQELAEVRNILTAEQRVKFDAAQARMKERMQNREKDGGRRGRLRSRA